MDAANIDFNSASAPFKNSSKSTFSFGVLVAMGSR